MDETKNLKIDVELPFASKRIAQIVYDVLRVDAEPKRSGVTKILKLENTVLKVKISGDNYPKINMAFYRKNPPFPIITFTQCIQEALNNKTQVNFVRGQLRALAARHIRVKEWCVGYGFSLNSKKCSTMTYLFNKDIINKKYIVNDSVPSQKTTQNNREFTGSLARQLRVALNNFFEKVDLTTETIQAFGPPTSETYNFY